MAFSATDLRLFGIDLSGFISWGISLGQRLRSPAWLDWAVAPAAVRVLRADGSVSVSANGTSVDTPAIDTSGATVPRFVAVELPADIILHRAMKLPPMSSSETSEAVKLDVYGASPFPSEDLVFGWRRGNGDGRMVRIDAVLASRRQAAAVLEKASAQSGIPVDRLEAWAIGSDVTDQAVPLATGQTVVVVQGFGEVVRLRDAARRRRGIAGLLLIATALLCALLLTPVVQIHLRAVDAQRAYSALQARTAALVQQREALLRLTDNAQALAAIVRVSSDPLGVIALLTETLPDTTYVQTLQVSGNKVSITGLTDDAAALMGRLGNTPSLREVRAPQAATRQPGTTKEAFVIEFLTGEPAPAAAPGGLAGANVGAVSPSVAPNVSGASPIPLPPDRAPMPPAVPPLAAPAASSPGQPSSVTAAASAPAPSGPLAPTATAPNVAVPDAASGPTAGAPSPFSIGGSSSPRPAKAP